MSEDYPLPFWSLAKSMSGTAIAEVSSWKSLSVKTPSHPWVQLAPTSMWSSRPPYEDGDSIRCWRLANAKRPSHGASPVSSRLNNAVQLHRASLKLLGGVESSKC